MQYEYSFITIELSGFSRSPKKDFKDIITEESQKGWRFVQLVQPTQYISSLQLIFEREAK